MESIIPGASQVRHADHIVIVDDDELLRDTVGDYLRMHGFRVSLCDGGASLRKTIAAQATDLIILDLRMPGEDGLSIMRDLKQRTSVPIIALTAIADASILEMGFDDYIAKPYQPRELLARVRVALRRNVVVSIPPQPQPMGRRAQDGAAKTTAAKTTAAKTTSRTTLVRFGTKWLDHDALVLRDSDGNEHQLSGPEYQLLKVFAECANRVIPRERLLDLAPTGRSDPFDRSIDVRIMRIRQKIEPDPAHPTVIRTVRGEGDKFVSRDSITAEPQAATAPAMRSSRHEDSK
jgi:DNA-binding response OmpR family regulator